MKKFTNWQTKHSEIIRATHGTANAYLIRTDRSLILVDTGRRADRRYLQVIIESTEQPLTHCVLTHTHYDHCANAAFIRATYGAEILVRHEEALYLKAGFTPLPRGRGIYARTILSLSKPFHKRIASYSSLETDHVISADSPLDQETKHIRILATPGHSSGSCSVDVDGEIVLAGDSIFGIIPGSVFPPFADNISEMIHSWERLLDTGAKLFLPGHGRPVSRDLLAKNYNKHHKTKL